MRFVDIKFSQRNARPGDSIRGVVVVETDKSFVCNQVVLKVKGKERTEMGSGDSKITDEHVHLHGKIILSEAAEIPYGKNEFSFEFKLKTGLPPTYSGYNGWIEYNVEAVVEMDWTLDPKMTRRFRVLPIHPAYLPESDGYNPQNKDTNPLHVELQSDVLRIKQGIPVRFMVDEHSRVNGVRVEIRRREYAKCRSNEHTHDVTIATEFIPISAGDFHRWKDALVGGNWRRVPFQSKLLRTTYLLKVVLEMRWDLDPFVTYRLKVSGEKPEEEIEDIFEAIAIDLGFD
ncbi:MAG: sporulation protein [Candidatus Thorarchaeota archaeon]|nr:sporulation protein [Candidatus Thorarchaeota archaeon]